ncbi:CgeB family protein [Paenibacillus methanolicus]|uniref:Spore maturation protein CgeB n=1 Tax=Paenibacillus methanolicus TaxID=582686 RepID=A0A5S5BUM0_9BACL|nr:glycosyltransferase [Paenibacillus methanolicus]TYP69850.1 spore maturation protein CgeB [Paenibacillus methanolicus]
MESLRKQNANAAKQGYDDGLAHGMRDGACEAIARSVAQPPPARRGVRVLYIPQGFEALDEGITTALRPLVGELFIAHASRIAEQAALIRPDWVFVLNGLHVFPDDHLEQIDAVRALGIKTAIWFADDPYVTEDTIRIAPRYDAVLTHELSTIPVYRSYGCANVHYMPLAVNIGRFKPQPVEAQYRSDVCFIGQAFWNRVEMFDAIARELASKRVFIAGGMWERLPNYKLLQPMIRHGWLPVEESVKYYNGAKIVINMHRATASGVDNRNSLNLPGLSINPRTYEIAACGTLQLTDVRQDLSDHYRPGWEVETYANVQELAAKLNHYLIHEEERRTIALRGLRRTLQQHSFETRLEQVAMTLGWE